MTGCPHHGGKPRPWHAEDFDDPEMVAAKRANALAFKGEHAALLAGGHLGKHVAYVDGVRVVDPEADIETVQAKAIEAGRAIRGKLACIFPISESTDDVFVP